MQSLKLLSHKVCINYKEKSSNLTVEKSDSHHSIQKIKVYIASSKMYQYPFWYNNALRRTQYPFCNILVEMYSFNLIMRKYKTNLHWETFHWITNFKKSVINIKKDGETLRTWDDKGDMIDKRTWIVSWTEKQPAWKNWWNLNKSVD